MNSSAELVIDMKLPMYGAIDMNEAMMYTMNSTADARYSGFFSCSCSLYTRIMRPIDPINTSKPLSTLQLGDPWLKLQLQINS